MQAALDVAIPYVHERKQFGKAVGTFQLMQGKIADIYTKLSASRSYVYAVGRACDAGKVSRRDCAGAILYSSDRAFEVATEAMVSFIFMDYWFTLLTLSYFSKCLEVMVTLMTTRLEEYSEIRTCKLNLLVLSLFLIQSTLF